MSDEELTPKELKELEELAFQYGEADVGKSKDGSLKDIKASLKKGKLKLREE